MGAFSICRNRWQHGHKANLMALGLETLADLLLETVKGDAAPAWR